MLPLLAKLFKLVKLFSRFDHLMESHRDGTISICFCPFIIQNRQIPCFLRYTLLISH